MTGLCHQAKLSVWDEVSLTFCPGWPWTLILLISISGVAGITGSATTYLAHHCHFACCWNGPFLCFSTCSWYWVSLGQRLHLFHLVGGVCTGVWT
jgi:hypothetical protein